jgi:hypothetical protein
MADSKISALTELAAADIVLATDLFVMVDSSVTTTKKATPVSVGKALNVLGSETATTSGTSVDLTGIPAGVKKIVLMLNGVSTDGTSPPMIQLGDAGGFENTGYTSGALIGGATSTFTTGFGIQSALAANTIVGVITLTLQDSSDFTWLASGTYITNSNVGVAVGVKALSAELTQIRLTTVGGSDNFDAGSITINYTY